MSNSKNALLILTALIAILLTNCSKEDNPTQPSDEQKTKPDAPVLISPINNADSVSQNTALLWQTSKWADSYSLQVSKNGLFTSSIILSLNNLTDTTYTLTNLDFNEKFYWRVNATNNLGTSNWSSAFNFQVTNKPNNPPNIPTDPNPYNNQPNANPLTVFSWSANDPDSDTLKYDIYLGTNQNPSILATDLSYQNFVYSTFPPVCNDLLPGGLSYGTTYYWKVVAKDNYGNTTISPIWKFTTRYYKLINKTSLPEGISGHSVTFLDNKIYVTGGVSDGSVFYSKNLYVYDLFSNSWVQKSSLDSARKQHSSCQCNGKLYVFGGYYGYSGPIKFLNSVLEYSPVTDQWIPKAPLSVPRANIVSIEYQNKMYCFGGDNLAGDLPITEVFDPLNNSWIRKTDIPIPLKLFFRSNPIIYQDKIMIFAAVDFELFILTYDPITDIWQKSPITGLNCVIEPWDFHPAVISNKIYLFGNYYIYLFNPTTRELSFLETLFQPDALNYNLKYETVQFQIVEALGGVYIIGGIDGTTGTSTNRMQKYTP